MTYVKTMNISDSGINRKECEYYETPWLIVEIFMPTSQGIVHIGHLG